MSFSEKVRFVFDGQPAMQNIVIIGASVAGHALANALVPNLPETHRIVLIDAQDFAYWPPGSLRAACRPGWEKKITHPLTQASVFGQTSRHKMVPGTRVVMLRRDAVILDKPFEGRLELGFFKAILATGSSQASPMRVQPGATLADAERALVRIQRDLRKATKVAIIGGGPVGVEMAGEIRTAFPGTAIAIVHDGPRLLERFVSTTGDDMFEDEHTAKVPLKQLTRALKPKLLSSGSSTHSSSSGTNPTSGAYTAPPSNLKLSAAMTKLLQGGFMEIIVNDRAVPVRGVVGEWDGTPGLQHGIKKIALRSGREIEADYVFFSVGNNPNSALVESVDRGAVVSGMIRVDQNLRVRSVSPDSVVQANYYAIGDCCSTPGWKTMQGAKADGEGVAENIIAEIRGLPVRPYKRTVMHGMLIPFGPEHGKGYFTLPGLGDTSIPEAAVLKVKSKSLFIPDYFLARFKGPQLEKERGGQWVEQQKQSSQKANEDAESSAGYWEEV